MKTFLSRRPLIYLITGGTLTVENFPEKSGETLRIIAQAVDAGIPLVQLREKNLPAKLVFELTERAARMTRNSETGLLVNDRADIALAAAADGVHLTSASLPTEIIKQNFPADLVVGVSCHTPEKCLAAKNAGADFVTFSPVFESPGKGVPQGLDALREVCDNLKPFPVIALGGIDQTNFEAVLSVAAGFAAIRFLNDAGNLRKLAASFKL